MLNFFHKSSFGFEKLDEFDDHKLVTYLYNPDGNLRGFIAIHRGGLKLPSFGATRIWKYSCESEALKDALRLSRLMSYKSALAGLKHGGAKAVLFDTCSQNGARDKMVKTYAQYVNFLDGHFITGADVGVSAHDLKIMLEGSKFMVGGKSDPVKFTVLGLLYGIEVCLEEIFGNSSLSDRTFAIQGVGKTGSGLLKLIYNEAKKIYISDINDDVVKRAKEEFPNVEVVEPDEIYKQKVDVFSPCALSHEVSFKKVSSFNCKIVAGCANNQLEKKEVGKLLYKLGILYAPDYVINAGGLITVVDEYENGSTDEKRVQKRVAQIKKTMKTIIEEAKKTKKATNEVADKMAQEIFCKFV